MLKKVKKDTQTARLEKVFGREYARTFLSEIPEEMTRRQVAFLVRALHLKKGDHVLDAGCGNGRHSLVFAEKGYAVTGLDASPHLISLAKKESKIKKVSAEFLVKDLREIGFKNKFDAVISIFSLGFFRKDEDNFAVLDTLCRAARREGYVLLAVSNPTTLIGSFEVNEGAWRREKEISLPGGNGTRITEIFDPQTYTHTVYSPSGSKNPSTVRLFTLPEIQTVFTKNEMKIVKIYGDLFGKKFSNSDQRMVIVAKKQI